MHSGNARTIAFLFSCLLVSSCSKSKTGRGAEIGGADKGCFVYEAQDTEFKYVSQQATVETKWHDKWTSRYGQTLPKPLTDPDVWEHPKLSERYASTMHENSSATDVSVEPGPIPANPRVEYFHVLEKGTRLSGMSPFYTFLDDHTIVTISFGRDAATLLVVDVSSEARVLDHVAIPGRGSKAIELMSKRARLEIFRDTSGGAYSYLDARGNVYVPGADNTLIGIPIRNRRIERDNMILVDLGKEVAQGTWVSDTMERRDNVLTALMPDAQGKIWFTSKYGIVGVIDVDGSGNCPHIYTTAVAYFALRQKLKEYLGRIPKGIEDILQRVEEAKESGDAEDLAALRTEGRRRVKLEGHSFEQIQNSFSVGPDGVYIVTNMALYKFRFNEREKRIELDPSWEPRYQDGDLVYENDRKVKPGHLNNGSGTTPTLVGDDFVAIVDNAPSQVNLLVFRQDNGTLVSRLPLFEPGAAAVENSVVSYGDHLIVGNTFGYTDPFSENPTAGGIMRFDFDEATGGFVHVEDWPAIGHFDGKTATPKLSTANGLLYVYHRDLSSEGHHDWQLTALDFRTGWPVFSIKGYFAGRDFDDNTLRIVRRMTLGKGHYGRKVFNNIWGTFSFGPDNSIFIGTFRGYVRFSSDQELHSEDAATANGVLGSRPSSPF
jgi:hypothetical protein